MRQRGTIAPGGGLGRGRPTRDTGVQLGGSLAGKLSSEFISTSSDGKSARSTTTSGALRFGLDPGFASGGMVYLVRRVSCTWGPK